MFGVRLSSLFTSRWFALLWVVLVCLTAVEIVGAARGAKGPDDQAADDAAIAVNAAF
jgi:hypothetical protein